MKALTSTHLNKGPTAGTKNAQEKSSIIRVKAQDQNGASGGVTWPELLAKSLLPSFLATDRTGSKGW